MNIQYSPHSFKYTVLRNASTQNHKEQKSFSRWALSSAPCMSSNWFFFFVTLNHVFWKHCYYPPMAHCTDECLSTSSPMFLSQSLSKCWINQPFNSRSYHEAAKPHFQFLHYSCCFLQQRHLFSVDSAFLSHNIICTMAGMFTWLLYILNDLLIANPICAQGFIKFGFRYSELVSVLILFSHCTKPVLNIDLFFIGVVPHVVKIW